MTERRVTAARALHARPASLLAKAAAGFDARVTVAAGAAPADARSVLALLALDVAVGDEIVVSASGPQAEAAIATIAAELARAEDRNG